MFLVLEDDVTGSPQFNEMVDNFIRIIKHYLRKLQKLTLLCNFYFKLIKDQHYCMGGYLVVFI